jgi:hypothetical protein
MDALLSTTGRTVIIGRASGERFSSAPTALEICIHAEWGNTMKRPNPGFAALVFAFGLAAAPVRAQHNVSLTWTASTSAAGNPSLTYNVYRSSGCSGIFALLDTIPISATSFLDVAVPSGTYCYQATAVLAGLESTPSNEASVVVLAAIVIAVPRGPFIGCLHRGPLIGWIRCMVSRPRSPKRP